jgi:DNA-binding NtrC family response regulator
VILSTLTLILTMMGFTAFGFSSAEAALTTGSISGPHILITDVGLPGMDGIQLAIEVTAQHPDCGVILLSGQVSTSDLWEDATRNGHTFELLAKPLHPTTLLAALDRYRRPLTNLPFVA